MSITFSSLTFVLLAVAFFGEDLAAWIEALLAGFQG